MIDKNMIALGEWIVDNLAWEFIVALIAAIIIFFRSFKTIAQILKHNRETLGNSYGDHLADRFMSIWHSNPQKHLQYKQIRRICIATGNGHIESSREEKDDKLASLGLIKVENLNERKLVRPILNWQNRFIAALVRFYLIYFIGDNPKYYKDLRQ